MNFHSITTAVFLVVVLIEFNIFAEGQTTISIFKNGTQNRPGMLTTSEFLIKGNALARVIRKIKDENKNQIFPHLVPTNSNHVIVNSWKEKLIESGKYGFVSHPTSDTPFNFSDDRQHLSPAEMTRREKFKQIEKDWNDGGGLPTKNLIVTVSLPCIVGIASFIGVSCYVLRDTGRCCRFFDRQGYSSYY